MNQTNYLRSSEHYNSSHSKFYRWVTYPVGLLLVGVLIFTVFGTYESSVSTTASITSDYASTIQTPLEASIVTNNLQEGKYVKKSTVLLKFDINDIAAQHQQLQETLKRDLKKLSAANLCSKSIKNNQDKFETDDEFGYHQQVIAFLAQKEASEQASSQSEQTYEAANDAFFKAKSNVQEAIKEQSEKLAEWESALTSWEKNNDFGTHEKDTSSINNQLNTLKRQFDETPTEQQESIRNTISANIQAQIDQSQSTLSQLKLSDGTTATPVAPNGDVATISANLASEQAQLIQSCEEQISSLDTEISTIRPQIITLNKQIEAATVRADQSGYIHLIDNYQKQGIYSKGTQLAQILPMQKTNQLGFTTVVTSNQISGIKKGQLVRFQIQSSDSRTKIITGKISRIATTSSQTKQGSFFKVTGKLKAGATKLHYGQVGKMQIITQRMSYLDKLLNLLLDK